jgi:hypothetical protein
MINIDYNEGIKVTTGLISNIFKPEQLPLRIEISKSVTNNTVWEVELNNNMWASYNENEMNDVIVWDKQDNIVSQYYWDVMTNGSYHYKSLWLYNKNLLNKGIKPKGIAIGTHDGEFGEWVPIALENKTEIILVEGSEPQFIQLLKTYNSKKEITFLNAIITPDGEDVEFFEGGRGYTNTIVERVIRNWETEKIESSIKSSISINDLIESHCGGKFDWLHLDIEGLDAKLIMAIKDEYLPNLIIFEDFNLLEGEKLNIFKFFTDRKYHLHSEGGICTAIK